MFENFKFLQKGVPEKITKAQIKRLESALNSSLNTVTSRISNYHWYIEMLLCVTSRIVLAPRTVFMLLIASIIIFYFVSRDIGRWGIVTCSYSIVSPVIIVPLHMLTVYTTLKYPLCRIV